MFGRSDCFYGVNCPNEFLDHASGFRGEVEQVDKETIEHNLYMIAHNRTGCETHIVLNNLLQQRRVVHMSKNRCLYYSSENI